MKAETMLAEWNERERPRTLLSTDQELIAECACARALVVDLAASGNHDDEIYDACAALGRVIAQQRGSPTFAALTLDYAGDLFPPREPDWLRSARAAVHEGFAAALTDATWTQAAASWDFPHCAVPVGTDSVAIAAGHPSDDEEVLASWAAKTARGVALLGIRTATLAGRERACHAMTEALTVAGIRVAPTPTRPWPPLPDLGSTPDPSRRR